MLLLLYFFSGQLACQLWHCRHLRGLHHSRPHPGRSHFCRYNHCILRHILINAKILKFAVVDWYLYSATFNGMRLAGLILIACGFIVVMLPSNWPDAIHTIIR